MNELLATSAGLGLAGLDPTGALIAVGALSAGARRRDVLACGGIAVLGTILFGTVLTLTVGDKVGAIQWERLVPPDQLSAVLEALVAAGFLWWGVARLRRPAARPPKPARARGTGTLALLVFGVLWALAAVTDPSFLALVVLGGRDPQLAGIIGAQTLWVLISQLPLVLMLYAIARGRHQRAVATLDRVWGRVRPVISVLGTATLLLGGVILLVDSLWWFVTGAFLIPGP